MRGQWGEGIIGTTIKDTWTKSRGRVVVGEGGGFGWGGVEGWGEKTYNCNWITMKILKKFSEAYICLKSFWNPFSPLTQTQIVKIYPASLVIKRHNDEIMDFASLSNCRLIRCFFKTCLSPSPLYKDVHVFYRTWPFRLSSILCLPIILRYDCLPTSCVWLNLKYLKYLGNFQGEPLPSSSFPFSLLSKPIFINSANNSWTVA